MARPFVLVASATAAAGVLFPSLALAQERSIIKDPGDHPSYFFEAEPHLILGFPSPYYATGQFGVGFRGTFNLANGFVPNINDSVGVGVGFDIGTGGEFYLPVVLQWNFWLSTHWSVFGEPGLAIGGGGPAPAYVVPSFFAGGRYHFTNRIALTIRIGYPDIAVGVSFFL
jgi:hypothetical protein